MSSYQEFIDLLKARRSIRAFKPDPLAESCVEQIIEAARWAPSGGDSQPWEFVVIRGQELKEKVVALFMKASEHTFRREQDNDPDLKRDYMVLPVAEPKFKQAPVFILALGDPRTSIAFPLRVKETKADKVLNSSLASAFLCMHLAARSLGLGSQWVSAIGDVTIEKELKGLLGIPARMKIYDMMAVGYPAYDLGPRSPRDIEEMTHYEGFQKDKYRSEQQI
ncbi:MAG: nitroreductase family protein, partial [Desulfobacterales bacterium]|nr:nitroreductase family protein [Desulfobacterales bacterium]